MDEERSHFYILSEILAFLAFLVVVALIVGWISKQSSLVASGTTIADIRKAQKELERLEIERLR